jgi:hypothetical protein
MPAPAENGRRIVHVDVASRPVALDRSSADHLSDPFCNNKVLQFPTASQASSRSIFVFRLDPAEGRSAWRRIIAEKLTSSRGSMVCSSVMHEQRKQQNDRQWHTDQPE